MSEAGLLKARTADAEQLSASGLVLVIGAPANEPFALVAVEDKGPGPSPTPPMRYVATAKVVGDRLVAGLMLPRSKALRIGLALSSEIKPKGCVAFELLELRPFWKNLCVDLRELATIEVSAEYLDYDQLSYAYNAVRPMRFEVVMNKANAVPASLLKFYKGPSWPGDFDPSQAEVTRYAYRSLGGTMTPAIFELLKGEGASVVITAAPEPPIFVAERSAEVQFPNVVRNLVVRRDLAEATTVVTCRFLSSDGQPAAARCIALVSPPYRGLPRAHTAADPSTGQQLLVQRLERRNDWSISATADGDAPCASIRGQVLPPLNEPSLSVPLVFSEIPANTHFKVTLSALADPSANPTVQIAVYKRLSEADIVGEFHSMITIALVHTHNVNFAANTVLPVPGGYWWRVSFLWTLGGQLAGFEEVRTEYPINNVEELNILQNFGVG